ncbi:S24 family peptidase [Bacillus thuringiensis]
MNRGEYLLKLIDDRGFTVMSLSKASGVAYTTLRSMLERNLNNASIDNVIKICQVLGIKVEDLNEKTNFEAKLKPYATKDEDTVELEIPLYNSLSIVEYIKMGGILQDSNFAPGAIKIPRKILGKYAYHKNLVAMHVDSESMNNIIPYGSYAIAKPIEYDEIQDNDIVIFSHNKEYGMKQVRRLEGDQVIVLSPDSTTKQFHDTVVPYSNQRELSVHAKIIWYSTVLR